MTDTRVKIRCEFCQVPSYDSRVIDHIAGCPYRRWAETGNPQPLLDAIEQSGWRRLLAQDTDAPAAVRMFGRNRLAQLGEATQDRSGRTADEPDGRGWATLRRVFGVAARRHIPGGTPRRGPTDPRGDR